MKPVFTTKEPGKWDAQDPERGALREGRAVTRIRPQVSCYRQRKGSVLLRWAWSDGGGHLSLTLLVNVLVDPLSIHYLIKRVRFTVSLSAQLQVGSCSYRDEQTSMLTSQRSMH